MTKKNFIAGLSVLLLLTLIFTPGCAPKEKRCVLTGTVTISGEPLPSGILQFTAQNPDPKMSVVGATADIIDGKYTLQEGYALLPGDYTVSVVANLFRNKKTGELVDPNDLKDGLIDPSAVESEDIIPPEFGVNSEQVVAVGEDKTMTYDVAIP